MELPLGTPFRALTNGEFVDDQIFNWSYIDEQREKNTFEAHAGSSSFDF